MKALLLFSILIFSNEILAQPQPTIVKEKQFGGSDNDVLKAFAEIELPLINEYPLIGESYSADGDLPGNEGQIDAWFLQLYSDWSIKSSHNYGGSADDGYGPAWEFTPTPEIRFRAMGYTRSPEFPSFHGGEDIYFVVLDSNGITLHERAYGGTGNERGIYISPFFNGYQLIVSQGAMVADGDWAGATTYDQIDIGLLKIDTNYNVVDKKIFGSHTFGFDLVYDAYKTVDGIRVLASSNATGGSFTTPIKGGDDIVVFDIGAADLQLSGEYRYGGTKVEYGYDIEPHPDEGFFVGGASWSNQWFFGDDNAEVRNINCVTDGSFNPNGIVFRADASGNIIWSQCFEGTDWDFVQACYYQHPDILYVVGHTASNDGDFPAGNPGSYDCFIAALDANTGEKKWLKVYGGSGEDLAYDIIRLEGGNLLTVNQTNSSDGDVASVNHGLSDAWIVEFTNPTGVEEPNTKVELLAYPNPADQSVTIDLPGNKPAEQLEILDACGQVISVLRPEQRAIVLEVSDYADGFYFIRIKQDQKTYYAKVVVAH